MKLFVSVHGGWKGRRNCELTCLAGCTVDHDAVNAHDVMTVCIAIGLSGLCLLVFHLLPLRLYPSPRDF